MNVRQIEKKCPEWIKQRIRRIARSKKCTFREAIIFCLKGVLTQDGRAEKRAEKRHFLRPEGVNTQDGRAGSKAENGPFLRPEGVNTHAGCGKKSPAEAQRRRGHGANAGASGAMNAHAGKHNGKT